LLPQSEIQVDISREQFESMSELQNSIFFKAKFSVYRAFYFLKWNSKFMGSFIYDRHHSSVLRSFDM